jgi:hypothetical protein
MSLSNPWARTSSASVAPCGLLASSLRSSSVRRGCGLRRRFRMVVIRPVSDARYVLSIDWRAVGLLGHAGPESHPRPPALCERQRSKNGGRVGLFRESHARVQRWQLQRVPSLWQMGNWAGSWASRQAPALGGDQSRINGAGAGEAPFWTAPHLASQRWPPQRVPRLKGRSSGLRGRVDGLCARSTFDRHQARLRDC